MGLRNLAKWFLGWLLVLVLAGCQVELYSGMPENEGNEILAVLLSHNIPATKTLGKKNMITIRVDEADVAASIEILKRNGFPRDEFAGLGELFKKEGLISSPLEERVRFTYGLSQTISETLSQIDGVLTARVHVVLPEPEPLEELVEPSSASVFIKYRPGMGVEESILKIKMIVQNSVEGLSYDNISVALFPAWESQVMESKGPSLFHFLGMQIAVDSFREFTTLFGALIGMLLAALGGIGYLVWRLRHGAPDKGEEEAAGG
ncbi:MAG: EscJ/YscJ/HrcJ family type III secretion inner membrane ring protein [Sulfitobacter sp.]|nr:EscJ/YscJ/HrcJ family type III secretion inner membrane ring protein [Sulfitobacter sp.]